MLIRVYFASTPSVLPGGRIGVSVSICSELGELLACPCELFAEVLDGSDVFRLLGPLEEATFTEEEQAYPGCWQVRIEGSVPASAASLGIAQLRVVAVPRPWGHYRQEELEEAAHDDLAVVEDWSWGDEVELSCLPCVSAPLDLRTLGVGPGHCFRHFWLGDDFMRVREELAFTELSTGGRLWDAGIVLADWLAQQKHCRAGGDGAGEDMGLRGPPPILLKPGSTFLELGCGCGLPGLAAAALLGGLTVLTDRPLVAAVVEANLAANRARVQASGGTVKFAALEWQDAEQRRAVMRDTNGGAPFDVLLLADLLYAPAAFQSLRDTVLAPVLDMFSINSGYQGQGGERWDALGDDGQPFPRVSRKRPRSETGEPREAEQLDSVAAAIEPTKPISERGMVLPLCRLFKKWFDVRLLQGSHETPTGVVLLECLRVR